MLHVDVLFQRVLLTKGIKEGKTYRIKVLPFTIYGYGQVIGPVLVNTPFATISPPEFMVSVDKNSIHHEALLTLLTDGKGKGFALRYGKTVAKSLPVFEEQFTLLPSNFSSRKFKIEPFLWHYFGLSVQGVDGHWSRENFKWLRGPLQGYTGLSTSPDSIILFWSEIDQNVNPDTYAVSFRASDELTKSKIILKNEQNLGYSRIKIASLREDTMYNFEISSGDAKCEKFKTIRLSVKTRSGEHEKEVYVSSHILIFILEVSKHIN